MFRSAATKIAHNSTIPALAGNQDLRPLQDLITAEKAVIISLQKLTADFSKASEALKTWGLGEGEDLGSILTASTAIITHFTSALSQYASHGHSMREQLKAIRTREEALEELKRRRRNVMSKADSADKKLQKMGPEHKNLAQQMETLNRHREEIRGLDVEIMRHEASLGDFKRAATRSWMGLKFGGLVEFCEKGVIVGEYGKLIISEIIEDETQPGLPRNPYTAQNNVSELIAETHRYVNEVRLSTVPSAAQPHHAEQQQQQLQQPPVTHPETTFINQGNFSSPAYATQQYPGIESYNDGSSALRHDILPESQSFGAGRFLESPTDNTSNPFSQNLQHHPQYSGSLSNVPAFQPQPGRQVDEFGNTQLIDTSNAGGGRFATFPVRTRTGSVGAPANGGQLPDPREYGSGISLTSPPQHTQSDSFSSSVAQAFAATSRDPRGDDHLLGKAPSYESIIASDNPWTGTAGATLGPNDRLAVTAAPHSRQSWVSEDEASLPYTSSPGLTPGPASSSGGVQNGDGNSSSSGVNNKHVSRHVRFGTVDDAPLPPMTPQYSLSPSSPDPTSVSFGSRVQDQSNRASWVEVGNRDLRQNQGVNPEERERALNAAAAREIALELQSSASSSTVPTPGIESPPVLSGIASPGLRELSQSPFAPPSASFMTSDRPTVSPRPPINVVTTAPPPTDPPSPGPAPSYTTEDLSHVGQYNNAQVESTSPSLQHQTPTSYARGQVQSRTSSDVVPSSQPTSPLQSSQGHYVQAPSYSGQESTPSAEQSFYAQERRRDSVSTENQTSPPSPQNVAPSQTVNQLGSYAYYAQRSGVGGTMGGGGYETGTSSSTSLLDQPNPPYMRPTMNTTNRSASSLNTPAGGGKISAAAFKRPSPRIGSAASPFASSGTSPLATGSSNSGGGGGGGSTTMSPTERMRSPVAYEPNVSEPAQRQSIPPLNVRKRETQELDADQYQYINAFVNSGGTDENDRGQYQTEQAQRAANAQAGGGGWAGIGANPDPIGGGGGLVDQEGGRGGYAQGRFATNLEGLR